MESKSCRLLAPLDSAPPDSAFAARAASSSLILFGAGGAGGLSYEELEALGLSGSILAFVDLSPEKQGRRLRGKPVQPLGFLADHPGALVVICATDERLHQIYQELKRADLPNEIYVYLCYMAHADLNMAGESAGREPQAEALARAWSLYDHDDLYTAEMIAFKIGSRRDRAYFFQPAEAVVAKADLYLNLPRGYWTDEGTRLPADEPLTVCDLGAYDGDSLLELWREYGSNIKKIYAFEPDPANFDRLMAGVNKLIPPDKIRCFCSGCGDQNGRRFFTGQGEAWSRVVAENTAEQAVIEMHRLDDLGLEISGRLAIKIDIEGLEMEALRGAAETIRRHRPELAICVYHKYGDLTAIPRYLLSLVPDYKFILRDGPFMVLYARPR